MFPVLSWFIWGHVGKSLRFPLQHLELAWSVRSEAKLEALIRLSHWFCVPNIDKTSVVEECQLAKFWSILRVACCFLLETDVQTGLLSGAIINLLAALQLPENEVLYTVSQTKYIKCCTANEKRWQYIICRTAHFSSIIVLFTLFLTEMSMLFLSESVVVCRWIWLTVFKYREIHFNCGDSLQPRGCMTHKHKAAVVNHETSDSRLIVFCASN